jgi:hypothetical protein
MTVTIRLPDTWSIEMVDHLLYFANELNNALIDQYGAALYEYWNQQDDSEERIENETSVEKTITTD